MEEHFIHRTSTSPAGSPRSRRTLGFRSSQNMESANQFPYSDEDILNTKLVSEDDVGSQVNEEGKGNECPLNVDVESEVVPVVGMIEDDVSSQINEEGTGNDCGLNVDVVSEDVPVVGMKFKDVDELYEFYAKYAYRMGFPVRKRNSRKGEDGILRNVAISCSREGKKMCAPSNSLKSQPTMQTGCKAKLTASSDVNGIWRITKIHLQHNHLCSPTKSTSFRCNRKLSANVKRQLEVNDIAGIPLHKTYNSTVVKAGGYEQVTFIERDCNNYIEKARRLRLGDGDAAAIQAYFCKMQAACPGFYFSLDLNW